MACAIGALLAYGVVVLARKISGTEDGPTKGHWE